jgi:hypothetical protein
MISYKAVLSTLIIVLCGNWAGAMEYEGNITKNDHSEKIEEKEVKRNILGLYLFNTTNFVLQPITCKSFKSPINYQWVTEIKNCGLPLQPGTVGFVQSEKSDIDPTTTDVSFIRIPNNITTTFYSLKPGPTAIINTTNIHCACCSTKPITFKITQEQTIPSLYQLCASLMKNLNLNKDVEHLHNLALPQNILVQKEEQKNGNFGKREN